MTSLEPGRFEAATAPYRRELLAHCYRMTGSALDAEDPLGRGEEIAAPADERARRVLDRYIVAFERSDMAAIEQLLADDAILEMSGTPTWFCGKATCVPFIAAQAIGQAGDWRMVPLRANGQLAARSI